jgi:hypothetical protein
VEDQIIDRLCQRWDQARTLAPTIATFYWTELAHERRRGPLYRLEQAWKDASGDARHAFLVVRYRKWGAAGESMIRIMG